MTDHRFAGQITLRLFTDDDLPFFKSLYATTREQELALTNFSDTEKEQFVAMQFAAQHAHYMQHYNPDAFYVVEVDDNRAGRLFLDYWESEIRIVDIALMPEYRNRGLGNL